MSNLEDMRQIHFDVPNVPVFYLEQTCGGCPEAYNVYIEDSEKPVYIGELYVRYGGYTISDKHHNAIAHPEIKGDGLFEWEEREHMLKLGCSTIYRDMMEKSIIKKLRDEDYWK